jgi:predicted lipoprotein with Yx(FWY)xxD motif
MPVHPNVRLAAVLAAGLGTALLAAGCSSSAPAPAAAPSLLSGSIGGNAVAFLQPHKTPSSGTVLANGGGYTLYWFSKDTPAYTACDDTCVSQWPPVTGTPKALAGTALTGKFGTLRRPDGVLQSTYDGHPLYTSSGDQDPGDAGGNGVTQFGGTWHVIKPG